MDSGDKQKQVGSLLKYKNLNAEDLDLYLTLIYNTKYKYLVSLRNILDNDKKFLELLDIFAGIRIWFPERERTYRYLEKSCTYNYLKNRDFSKDAYSVISKLVEKRVIQVKSMITNLEATLVEREEMLRNSTREVEKLLNKPKVKRLEDYIYGVKRDEK